MGTGWSVSLGGLPAGRGAGLDAANSDRSSHFRALTDAMSSIVMARRSALRCTWSSARPHQLHLSTYHCTLFDGSTTAPSSMAGANRGITLPGTTNRGITHPGTTNRRLTDLGLARPQDWRRSLPLATTNGRRLASTPGPGSPPLSSLRSQSTLKAWFPTPPIVGYTTNYVLGPRVEPAPDGEGVDRIQTALPAPRATVAELRRHGCGRRFTTFIMIQHSRKFQGAPHSLRLTETISG